jgi:MFS family permease
MTGETPKSSSWLHRLAVPAILAALQATWISIWVAVVARDGSRGATLLPFLAVAGPAVAGTLLVALVAARLGRVRPPGRRWAAVALLALGVLIAGSLLVLGTAVTAGLIDHAVGQAPFATAGFAPWRLHQSGTPLLTTQLSWIAAIVIWLSALWLGVDEPDRSSALFLVSVAAAFLVGFFVTAAIDDAPALHDQRTTAVVLSLLAFLAGGALLAIVHERDLERRAMRRPGSGPGAGGLVALGVTMGAVVAIAGVAVLAAVLAGPLAPVVARGVAAAATWLVVPIGAFFDWVGRILDISGGKATAASQPQPESPGFPALQVVLFLAAIAIGIRQLIRWLKNRTRRPPRDQIPAVDRKPAPSPAAEPEPFVAEESESVFSWGRLLGQLRTALLHLLRRLFRRGPDPAGEGAGTGRAEEDSVRAQYRRLLAAAAEAGKARGRSETTLELQHRLSAADRPPSADPLARLTEMYNAARYGGVSHGDEETARATEDVAALEEWLLVTSASQGQADP